MQTWGSHGDIRPFLALADGLQQAGHEVTLVITCVDSGRYKQLQSDAGVTIIDVASPVFDKESDLKRIGEAIVYERNPVRQARKILTLGFEPALEPMYAAAQQLCADNELLIGHFFQYPLQACAELQGLPYVSIMLQHNMVPSAYVPPAGVPQLGKFVNHIMWRLARWMLNYSMKSYPNRFRQRLGLPPVKDLLSDVWASKTLTLIAVSAAICQRQLDWPDHYQVCGFLDMPNLDLEGGLSDELEQFLAAGDAPVYMTFGSLTPKDIDLQQQTLRLFSKAARLANCRAIIQARDFQACGFSSDSNVHFLNSAPHALLFPRCKAVVHHGGSGTTQTACLSGKPSIIVAHIAEQAFWGDELRRAGIARLLQRRKVTAAQLAEYIAEVTASAAMTERAAETGETMHQEDGVSKAVRLIEQRFKKVNQQVN